MTRAYSAAAQRELDRFLAAYPQVIHAEYCDLPNGYKRRVFILRGDTEFEGRSRSTFADALGAALVKANGGYPKGLPGDGGFMFRDGPDGYFATVNAGHKAYARERRA